MEFSGVTSTPLGGAYSRSYGTPWNYSYGHAGYGQYPYGYDSTAYGFHNYRYSPNTNYGYYQPAGYSTMPTQWTSYSHSTPKTARQYYHDIRQTGSAMSQEASSIQQAMPHQPWGNSITSPVMQHLPQGTSKTSPGMQHLPQGTSKTSPGMQHLQQGTSKTSPGMQHLPQGTSSTSPGMQQPPKSTSTTSLLPSTNDSGYYGTPAPSTHYKQHSANSSSCLYTPSSTISSPAETTSESSNSTSFSSFDDLLPISPLMLDQEAPDVPLSPTSMTKGDDTDADDILAAAIATLSDTSDSSAPTEDTQPKDILAAAVATLTDTVDFSTGATSSTSQSASTALPAPNTSVPASLPHTTRVYRKRNKLLNPNAIAIMTEWFESHLSHPYPTQEEKELMAAQGGISLAQVISWFNNKRNRSANTAPKKQKRKLEQQLSTLCNDLMSGSRSGHSQASQIVNDINKLIEDSLAPVTKKQRV